MASQYLLGSDTRLLECPHGVEYDQEAFHYFLSIEQARAQRARLSVHVLLASFEPTPDRPAVFPSAVAAQVFNGLRMTLRDTDVVGWHEQGRVAGAVMHINPGAGADIAAFERRVESALRRRLPKNLARRLRVRVLQPETAALAAV